MKNLATTILATYVLFNASAISNAATSATNEPLVQQSNLIYEGSFRLPEGTTDQTSFAYAGYGLTYDPTNNGLILTGHTWYQLTAEVTIPSPVIASAASALPTASLIQPLTDALDGNLNAIDPNSGTANKIGGYLVYNGKLIISAYSSYDGNATQSASHFVRSIDLTTGSAIGPYRVGTQYPGFVSGYMTLIPPEWQPLLGGPALTGNCCLNIISAQSNGPAASVFDPSQIGVSTPTQATPLVGYPITHPLDNAWNVQSSAFNGTTRIKGIAFPNGTRSVLFFGRQGIGPFCYGLGVTNSSLAGQPDSSGVTQCYDPAESSKGTHAYPYIYQIWAYDANDLLKVKQGLEPEYDVQPYAIWQLSLPFEAPTANNVISGVAYDPNTNQIFVTQDCAYNGCYPIVDVFKISGVSASSKTPSAPVNVQVN